MASIRHWALIAGFTCGAAFWLAACGSDDETPAEAASDQTAPGQSDSERSEAARGRAIEELEADLEVGENGEIRYSGETETGDPFVAQLGGDVEIPAAIYDEIPPYPEATPFSAMEAGEGMTMVTFESTDGASDIYEFYKKQLVDSGWLIENDLTVSDARVLRASRADRRVVLNIESIDGATRFGFVLSSAE